MKRSVRTMMWLLVGLATLASCASYQRFKPRESVAGESLEGHPAAVYPLEHEGEYRGTLRLWSRGAWDDEDDRGELTVLHIGVEVDNAMDAPLELETVRLRGLSASGDRRLGELLADRVKGARAIGAQATGTAEFWFLPGAAIEPGSIRSFEVEWSLRAGDGTRFSRVTPFRAWDPPRYSDPYWGFRGGFYFGPWGCW